MARQVRPIALAEAGPYLLFRMGMPGFLLQGIKPFLFTRASILLAFPRRPPSSYHDILRSQEASMPSPFLAD